jgi:hypothetical protein
MDAPYCIYVRHCHSRGRMKAELLFRQRIDYEDGGILEMKLWRVPAPVAPSAHRLKYSLRPSKS